MCCGWRNPGRISELGECEHFFAIEVRPDQEDQLGADSNATSRAEIVAASEREVGTVLSSSENLRGSECDRAMIDVW